MMKQDTMVGKRCMGWAVLVACSLALGVGMFAGGVTAQAAILFEDDFNGAAGAPDAAKWSIIASSVTLNGLGQMRVDKGDVVSTSTFLHETLTFEMSQHLAGNGFFGYGPSSGLADAIMIRPDAGAIQVIKGGVTTASAAYATPGSLSATIEWAADLVRVTIDGSVLLEVTDPTKIPDVALGVRFTRYGNAPNFMEIDSVQVGTVPIPEPSALGLMGLGAALICVRKRRY